MNNLKTSIKMIKTSEGLTIGEHRGHEHDEIEDIGDMVDYISNLPDCILHHILSFMPTKEVVKTSILSPRWKNLWTCVPNIDINANLYMDKEADGRCCSKATSLMNFLERVLRLRGPSNIKTFRVQCFIYRESKIQSSEIHSWISDAVRHNVQELDLDIYGGVPSLIPWYMFDRLVSLKIRSYFQLMEFPSCISFPCLKTLHLRSVAIPNDDRAEKLLLGCPVLEELVLIDLWNQLKNLKNFVISNSTLKRLTMENSKRSRGLFDPDIGCKIKIDAANLTYFEYSGYLTNEILFCDTSSLVNSCLHIFPQWHRNVICQVINLLIQLQNVASFRLSRCTLKSLINAKFSPDSFPVFPNLGHLMLSTEISISTFRVLMDLLSFCPVLRSICFSEGFKRCKRPGESSSIWSSVPTCITNCLKTVTMKKFHGYDSEICFLKCVLKYACVLERMDIRWSETELPDMKKTEVMTELETIERSSTSCVIKFL